MSLVIPRLIGILILISIVILWMPQSVFATQPSVIFSEIEYDLKSGVDAGREWIEVQNIGTSSISLATYKLFENKINHDIKFISGKSTLQAGEYAVIATNAKKFLLDNPFFGGNLFDSSFSLLNTGESLAIRDSKLSDVDTLSYQSSQGASGNGNSLQKSSAGSWVENVPTPGVSNAKNSTAPLSQTLSKTDLRVVVVNQAEITTLTAQHQSVGAVPVRSGIQGQRNQRATIQVVKENLQKLPGAVSASKKPASSQNSLPIKSATGFSVWIISLIMLVGFAVLGFLFVNHVPVDMYEIIEG
jgi:hypothetical protein